MRNLECGLVVHKLNSEFSIPNSAFQKAVRYGQPFVMASYRKGVISG